MGRRSNLPKGMAGTGTPAMLNGPRAERPVLVSLSCGLTRTIQPTSAIAL